jgi:hypothetical protein
MYVKYKVDIFVGRNRILEYYKLILEILCSQLWTVKILFLVWPPRRCSCPDTPINSSIVTRRSSCQNVSYLRLDLITDRTRLKYRYSHTPSWHSNISEKKRWVNTCIHCRICISFCLCVCIYGRVSFKRNIESYDAHLSNGGCAVFSDMKRSPFDMIYEYFQCNALLELCWRYSQLELGKTS